MAINLAPAQQLDEQRRRDLINSLSLQQHPLAAGPGDRELQQRRAQLDQSFANARSLLQPMAAGQAGPFTPAVQQGLFAGAADAAAGQQRAARGAINQMFARQGLVGSGGALQAQLDAQRQIGKGLQQARTAIGTTAALENHAAKERAISQLLQLLGQETAYQSRFEVTGEDPLSRAFANMLGGGGSGGAVLGGVGGGGGRSAGLGAGLVSELGYSGGATAATPMRTVGGFDPRFPAGAQLPNGRTGFGPFASAEAYDAAAQAGFDALSGLPAPGQGGGFATNPGGGRVPDAMIAAAMARSQYGGFPAAIVNGRANPAYPQNVIGRDSVPLPWDYWVSEPAAPAGPADGGFVEKFDALRRRYGLDQPPPASQDFADLWWDLYNRWGEPRSK